ncbi:DNA ligase, partial [Lachnellula suecica]
TSPQIYLVVSTNGTDSAHATLESANERVSEAKSEGTASAKVEVHDVIGGSVQVDEKKAAAKPKAKPVAVKKDEDEPPKKTKPVAEQRAANASKPAKTADGDLPDNVKALMASTSDKLDGFIFVVTGVPPTLGRKNAEKLVQVHGAKLGKSITGKTNYVVVGNDAGPKKLEQIESLGIKTLDEDELIEMLERGGVKRSADDDDEDEEEEEEKPAKAKKQKK